EEARVEGPADRVAPARRSRLGAHGQHDHLSAQYRSVLRRNRGSEAMNVTMTAGGCVLSFLALAGVTASSRETSRFRVDRAHLEHRDHPGQGPANSAVNEKSARAPVTRAQADRWATELSNSGRWGKDDQLGAMNLVTPQKRQQAMALARTGTVISLERRVVLTPKPEESKADGKPHGVSFYEIRFKTFPAG